MMNFPPQILNAYLETVIINYILVFLCCEQRVNYIGCMHARFIFA